jgi:serine/threonine-protein kinase
LANEDCVTEADLRAFLFGDLPEPVAGLIARHLERCVDCEAVAQRLDPLIDPFLHSMRRALHDHPGPETDVRPASRTMPDSPAIHGPSARYQLHGEIARGGMGAILKGRDTDLGRDIAVKVLLAPHHGKPELLRRFVEEAQIGGQLQHPGIVPVYELGRFPDQRPYFTMKLVKGQTLAKLLRERADPAQDRPRFLKVFEQVCQTLAYAHARGVIHRDLHPANIMVGAFGEVQVMDWGLAKVLADRGLADEQMAQERRAEVNIVQTLRSSETPAEIGSQTHVGSVLGTPAYMAPEQALGEVGRLDERCDVFGLGAILCEILTGKPPYVGEGVPQVHHKATRADLAEAFTRLEACGADAELVQLARSCLAAEPVDRPRDAGALAAALTAYLESVETRLRQAEVERAAAQAKAVEERRRRRVSAALAAAVLGLVLLGGGGWLWRARQRGETARVVNEALQEATVLQRQAKWEQAQAAAKRAEGLLASGGGGEDLHRRVQEVRFDLDMVRRLEDIRTERARRKEPPTDFAQVDRDFMAAFKDYGIDLEALGADEAATRIRERAIAVELATTLDDWARMRRKDLKWPAERWRPLGEVAQLADPDPWRHNLREALAREDRQALRELASKADLKELPPATAYLLGLSLAEGSEADATAAVDLLTRAHWRHPEDFWLSDFLANHFRPPAIPFNEAALALRGQSPHLLLNLGNSYTGSKNYAAAISIFEALLDLEPPVRYAAPAWLGLGNAWAGKGDLDKALASYRTALRLADEPTLKASAHYNMGKVYLAKNALDDAIAAHRESIRLRPESPEASNNLGVALQEKGAIDQAIAAYRKAIDLDPKHAAAYDNLGRALLTKNVPGEAVVALTEAARLLPDNARTFHNLAAALGLIKRFDEALAAERQAIRLQPDYSDAYFNLGIILRDKGDHDGAVAAFRETIRLKPGYAAAFDALSVELQGKRLYREALAAAKDAIRLAPTVASYHLTLGNGLASAGDLDAAITAYKDAVRLKPEYDAAWNNLGQVLAQQGLLDEAISAHRQAVRFGPKVAPFHSNLASALLRQGHFDDAIAAARTALHLDQRLATAHDNLGVALVNRDDFDAGLTSLGEAVRLEPNNAEFRLHLGLALAEKGELEAAVGALQETIRLAPFFAFARCQLGLLLQRQGEFTRALAALQLGHELGSRGPKWPYASARWIRDAERKIELNAQLPAFLKGEMKPGSAEDRIECAEVCKCKKLYLAASRLSVEALNAKRELAEDRKASHRFNAACSAALAACGQGDAAKLDEKERASWRQQALTWLRADLVLWAKHIESGKPEDRSATRQALRQWQRSPDLAGIRNAAALVRLPKMEREACQQLWAEVRNLLTRAGSKK